MTCNEFNDKYKEWLEEGHYGMDITHSRTIEWLDEEVFPSLIKIQGFKYSQIKMKFGSSRFYSNLHTICPFFGGKMEEDIENTINTLVNEKNK